MAKGSVRKKGKKWYYRFYVEDESGRRIQKEFAGTESKSETQALLRKAMEEYDSSRFIAAAKSITFGELLDIWVDEDLKPGNLSNGTVMAYQSVVQCIKKHPIASRKLKTITAEHLQAYIDLMSFGGTSTKPLSKGYMRLVSAVLKRAFRFAVFPKKFIAFDPMQYVVKRERKEEYILFSDNDSKTQTITHKQFIQITDFLKARESPALLPIQIAYYTGLRIGEACGLTWQDIELDGQYLTIRRSLRYNSIRHKTELGSTKRNKVRTVDFCDTLAGILKAAKAEQDRNRSKYGELYSINCYRTVKEKDRTYYEVYSKQNAEALPDGYKEISLVCTHADGAFTSTETVTQVCSTIRRHIKGLEDFHFHMLRHTYTSNLLSVGASPKDVQELLGHSDVSTTMNIYAHAAREAKRTSARLLDRIVGAT